MNPTPITQAAREAEHKQWRDDLFSHFSQNHDLHLLQSEMDDIECLIARHRDYLAQMNGSPAGAIQMPVKDLNQLATETRERLCMEPSPVVRLQLILAALETAVTQALEMQIVSVLRIRCTKHLNVPQQNSNEHSGGECGACIAAERDTLRQQLAEAKGEVDQLRSKLRKVCEDYESARNAYVESLKAMEFQRDETRGQYLAAMKELMDAKLAAEASNRRATEAKALEMEYIERTDKSHDEMFAKLERAENANADLNQQLQQANAAVAQEQERWQTLIYDLCCKATKDLSVNIDGAGCDSGDPLDFTLAEITQAINAWRDKAEQANAASGVDVWAWVEQNDASLYRGSQPDMGGKNWHLTIRTPVTRKFSGRTPLDVITAAMEGSRTK